MSHITLIRHGQANSSALDEISYDRLSPLGEQQAIWLGEHLAATGQHHTRLYVGSLRRHAETAAAMQTGLEPQVDPRLNELAYFTLSQSFASQYDVPQPQTQAEFAAHLPRLFDAWREGRIADAPETFEAFETRVTEALSDIAKGDGPALVVTSGGLISMVMRQHLGLDIPTMANITLSIMNTSIHRLFPVGGTWSPVMFNAIPHLEQPERHHAQTHV